MDGMEPITRLGGDTLVAVQPTGSLGQRILVQATPQGAALAHLLAGGENPARRDDFFTIPHDPDVDARLYDLVDALTTIRWSHPIYTQLVLDLQVVKEGQ